MIKENKQIATGFACVVLLLVFFTQTSRASSEYVLSSGQTVYVPVYSNVFSSPKAVANSLANLLSLRNTDTVDAIRITTADYYDTKGKLVKRYLAKPITLGPLESTHFYLSERDREGGVGANFIVRWDAAKDVNAPVIECVMVGNQGRAFVSPGQVIKEVVK